jgi:hypothetical protein
MIDARILMRDFGMTVKDMLTRKSVMKHGIHHQQILLYVMKIHLQISYAEMKEILTVMKKVM